MRKGFDKKDDPFAPNIKMAGEKHGIALATTVQFYEKIRCVKFGEIDKEKIAKEIFEGKWVSHFL